MNPTTGAFSPLEESVRRAPAASVFAAFLTGFLLRILPVCALVRALIRVATALIRPALLVFGIAKAIELLRERR
jgi:hypothetical protein